MVACAAMHGPSTDSTAGKHQTLTEHYRRTFFCARVIFLKSFEMHQEDILYLNVWHLQDKEPVQNDYAIFMSLRIGMGFCSGQRSHA